MFYNTGQNSGQLTGPTETIASGTSPVKPADFWDGFLQHPRAAHDPADLPCPPARMA